MWFGFVGSTTILPIARPRNASGPGVTQAYVALLMQLSGELRPVVAAVRRLVDADTGLAAGAAPIGLTRAEVERVAGRIVRIGGQRADRVLRDPAREVRPARIRGESVVRPPNASAGDADPEPAVPRHARRRDDESWTRLAVCSVPVNASTPGSIAFCSGPYACQWLLPFGSPWAAILLNVFLAFCTIDGGITLAGYVRSADLYASYPPIGPSLGIVREFLRTCVRVAGHLTVGLAVLRGLTRRSGDGNEPVAASDKSHCRGGRH